MTRLIDRATVFAQYQTIADEISEMQKTFYDDDYRALCETEAEYREYQDLFDLRHLSLPKNNKIYKVIAFDHSELKTYTSSLADKLGKLFIATGIKNFIVATHLKMPFVGNIQNKYPQLQKAFRKLESITGNINYHDAIEADLDSLFDLVDIAFWIGRCDAAGPEYIFFHDTADRISFNICKHGNVHLLEYEKETLPGELLQLYGWQVMDDQCYEKFTADGKIKGRRLKI